MFRILLASSYPLCVGDINVDLLLPVIVVSFSSVELDDPYTTELQGTGSTLAGFGEWSRTEEFSSELDDK